MQKVQQKVKKVQQKSKKVQQKTKKHGKKKLQRWMDGWMDRTEWFFKLCPLFSHYKVNVWTCLKQPVKEWEQQVTVGRDAGTGFSCVSLTHTVCFGTFWYHGEGII